MLFGTSYIGTVKMENLYGSRKKIILSSVMMLKKQKRIKNEEINGSNR